MTFGAYLKQLRESRQMTLKQAGRQIGISAQRVWDIENGLRFKERVPRDILGKIANAYRVPPALIVEASNVKVLEKQIFSEYLAETRVVLNRAHKLAARIADESRRYTPELEADSLRLFELVSDLKIRVDTAYENVYSNTPNRGKKGPKVEE